MIKSLLCIFKFSTCTHHIHLHEYLPFIWSLFRYCRFRRNLNWNNHSFTCSAINTCYCCFNFPAIRACSTAILVGSLSGNFLITAAIQSEDNCVLPPAPLGFKLTVPFLICLLSERIVTLPSFATQTWSKPLFAPYFPPFTTVNPFCLAKESNNCSVSSLLDPDLSQFDSLNVHLIYWLLSK